MEVRHPAQVCSLCAGAKFVDTVFSVSWTAELTRQEVCPECLGTGLAPMSDEELDELADSLDCAGCLSAPAVAVIDSRALCERCASDASASFARSEDSGVDLLSGFDLGTPKVSLEELASRAKRATSQAIGGSGTNTAAMLANRAAAAAFRRAGMMDRAPHHEEWEANHQRAVDRSDDSGFATPGRRQTRAAV